MRQLVAAIAVVSLIACSKKSTVATAPLIVDTFSVAGPWTGCIIEPQVPCTPATMTLSDTATTDSTGTVAGAGSWGETVAIHGTQLNANVTLTAKATDVVQGWSFAGVVSGESLSGTMRVPGSDTTFTATFTRSP